MTTEPESSDVWKASRAGAAIHDLNQVDKDIAKLLSIASSSIVLLSLPQTDGTEDETDNLPKGDERSEQFVDQAGQYFALLEDIQIRIKAAIGTIRHHRINPSVIDATLPGAVPPTFGVGLPNTVNVDDMDVDSDKQPAQKNNDRGFQESRVEREAWKNLHGMLLQLRDQREAAGQ